MARRTKAELITEIKHAAACFDTMIDCINAHGPSDVFFDKRELITERAYLEAIERGDITASQALGGLEEGVNENGLFLIELMADNPDQAATILNCYIEKTGRDYWTDAKDPQKAVTVMLKRGTVESEAEYYLLKEAVIDTAGKLIKDRDRQKAGDMLAVFEKSAV